ncbi:MAG: DUF58 domain-containing protein [Chloroflexi bacterium]|nr:DUF58 domain-containing protein [Chloroflexota bacterium]
MNNLFWALLLLFLVGVLLRMDWVYYLVYVIGGMWVFSHWWIKRSVGKLDVQRQLADHAFLGEKIPVEVRFTNRSWLPLPWLQLQELVPLDLKDALDYSMVISVGSRAVVEHDYTLYCKRRGYYALGPLSLRTGDLFGFVDTVWQTNQIVHITVYPQVLALHKLGLPSRAPFGVIASRQRLFEDPTRLAGVRAYTNGDSQRAIHWKASAHSDSLLVKKFQPAIALNVAIVLDLNREAYPHVGEYGLSEWAIVIAASIASHMVQQRQPVGLITNGLDVVSDQLAAALPSRNGQGQLMSILSLLARLKMHVFAQDLATWLPKQIAHLEWGTTLIVVTPQLDEQALWVLHNAYRRGSQVIVLLCAPQIDLEVLQSRGKRLGIAIYKTIWEKDLEALETLGTG